MHKTVTVSTPSRLCLFGEHQDYLGLEVIALAIDLRFFAQATPRADSIISIRYQDDESGQDKVKEIDISKPIVYSNKRDYMNSVVNLLIKRGYPISHGYDVLLRSQVPIGKGMCSSTTLVMALVRLFLECIGHPDKDDPKALAMLGFDAEVTEFGEPGGKMDHCTSAMGQLVHLNFADNDVKFARIERKLPGVFILVDSLQDKDTLAVLSRSKIPVLEALEALREHGVSSIRDFVENPQNEALLSKLDDVRRRKVEANIDNYKILRQALQMLNAPGEIDDELIGKLLTRHQANLRDGLEISTPRLEQILDTALQNGALGGKLNGSGGGGCCYVYAREEDCARIIAAIESLGYPATLLRQDSGSRREEEEIR